MAPTHLNPGFLDRLLCGVATPEEVRALVRDLLADAAACGDLASLSGSGDAIGTERAGLAAREESALVTSDELFDRVRARLEPSASAFSSARAKAPFLFEELLRHPLERQRILVLNNPRFQSLPLAEVVLEAAWERSVDEPAAARAMVDVALDILDKVDGTPFGEPIVNDLRGRAWAYRGNFLRIGSFLREAEEAFLRAESILLEGTGDLLEVARVLGLKATLRRVQQRREEAGQMLDQALALYLVLGERHLAGRTLVSQALLLSEGGDAAGAIEVLRQAQGFIEPEREPYLVRVVQQNLASYLLSMGRHEEAMSLIPALRARMLESGGRRIELLRLRWLEGQILLGLGHEARAEAAFLEVRKGFVELGIADDAAAVSLELAGLYLRQGRTAEIRDLASQLVPIFQSRDLHREAIAALLLFQQAVERDALTLRLVEEVADVVRKSREKPLPKTEEPS